VQLPSLRRASFRFSGRCPDLRKLPTLRRALCRSRVGVPTSSCRRYGALCRTAGPRVGAPSTYRFLGRCPFHLPVLGSLPPHTSTSHPPTGSRVGAPSAYRFLGRCPFHLPVLGSVPPHASTSHPPTGSQVGAPSTYRSLGRCPDLRKLPTLRRALCRSRVGVPTSSCRRYGALCRTAGPRVGAPSTYRFSGRCPLHLPVLGSVPPPPYRFSGRCPLHLPVLGSVPPPPTGSRVGAHMRSCHDYGARSADSWVGAPHPQLPSLRRALQPNGPVPSAPQPPTC
jgi:hypothetical protein